MTTVHELRKTEVPAAARLIRGILLGQTAPHYPKVARVFEARKYTPAKLRAMVGAKDYRVLVACRKAKPVGFLITYIEEQVAWIAWAGVAEEVYLKGPVFGAMFKALEKILRRAKVHKMWSASIVGNAAPQRLVQKAGFRKVGILHKHWHKLDFVLLEKAL